jgi:predicted glycosyltransferase
MKIIQYCQHVLGIGHLVRTLEILKAFENHEVLLVNGGRKFELPLPPHVREFRLPALMMDPQFTGLLAAESEMSLEQIKARRREILVDFYSREAPALLLIELFPFGRRSFRFEIDPLIQGIRRRRLPPAFVACSLRDILVERGDRMQAYEKEVVAKLNHYFDVLLVHADPHILPLDATFASVADIRVPVVYTGFVTGKPVPDARSRIRRKHGIGRDELLIVASAGGGSVGAPLLKGVVEAFGKLRSSTELHLMVFAGPFVPEEEYHQLTAMSGRNVQIVRFTVDFLSYLAAADLSVSMAGYNTCMNILASRVPALVWPFSQNREQGLRARRLAAAGALEVLEDADLQAGRLASKIEAALQKKFELHVDIDMNGAAQTAAWLLERCRR